MGLLKIQRRINSSLKPPSSTVSKWADKRRFLSREASAEPGRWQTARAPFQRGPMDAIFENDIETVVIKAATQMMKTEVLLNVIGYHIDEDPCPILAVQPSLSLAKTFSKDRLAPMIRDTPVLREKVSRAKSRDSYNTIQHKRFLGGHVTIVSAQTAGELAMRPIRLLICDEVDKFPKDVSHEGDPIDLAKKRTATFAGRKVYITSSPTTKGNSVIEYHYSLSDQRIYLVPCPACKHAQSLIWKNLKWERTKTGSLKQGSVYYECGKCKAKIKETSKIDMLAGGYWDKQRPSITSIAGFWINELYSPWKTWDELVETFLRAKSDIEQLKVFVNTSLAESFEEQGETPDWQIIAKRPRRYCKCRVPTGGLVLVAGADVQPDRIEVEIKAYGKNKRSWSIDYRIFFGSTEGRKVWQKLDDLLEESFEYEQGGALKISMLALDSGFATNNVYAFGRKYGLSRVMVIKGGPASQNEYITRPSIRDFDYKGKTIKRGVRLFTINVTKIKTQLFIYLKTEDENHAGYMAFPVGYDEEYFKQLTAEVLLKKKDRHGFYKYEYKKAYDRNEVLDCNVYARAASMFLGVDYLTDLQWDQIKKRILEQGQSAKQVNKQGIEVISKGVEV